MPQNLEQLTCDQCGELFAESELKPNEIRFRAVCQTCRRKLYDETIKVACEQKIVRTDLFGHVLVDDSMVAEAERRLREKMRLLMTEAMDRALLTQGSPAGMFSPAGRPGAR
jgi:hypothetical protein